MRFRSRVGLGYGQYWRGVIFDQEYKNLDDLVSKSQRWFPKFFDGAKFLRSAADYKWVWKSGEELLFRAVKKPDDYWAYHGQEFPFIGWNELTKHPTDELFELMVSCNRSSFLPNEHIIKRGDKKYILPEIPLEIFATTNPYGVGHNWVKRKFIDKSKPGELLKIEANVFNPRTGKKEEVVKTQTHIFGSYRENKYLSPEYVLELSRITDPNKKKAWEGGSWDITSGGMFDDLWDSYIHKIDPFEIPFSWKVMRSFDYGSSKPFSVGWWAISDGSDVLLPNGGIRTTIKGDMFRIGEWYGSSGKPNTGLMFTAKEISKGIIEREMIMGIHNRVIPGPADNSIWDMVNGNCIAVDMLQPVVIKDNVYPGVRWLESNKRPGSRKYGWLKLREALGNSKPEQIILENGDVVYLPRSSPGLFVFNTCEKFVELVPSLQRDKKDPDDVDTNTEDHIGDETRYFVLNTGAFAMEAKNIGQEG